MPYFAPVEYKIQTAFYNYFLTSSISGRISSSFGGSGSVAVYRGESNATKVAPCIICSTAGSIDDQASAGVFTGVQHVETIIKVEEMAADTSSSLVGVLTDTVWDMALDTTLNLSSYETEHSGTLFIFNIIPKDRMSGEPKGDAWVSELKLDIIASG